MESEQQYIRIRAILEIVGKPKEYIEQKMKEYITRMKEDAHLMVIEEHVHEAHQRETVWSTIAEIEVAIQGVSNLVGFCIDYMPASVDIIKPESFAFDARIFTGIVNDIVAKLHRVDMLANQLGAENTFLKKNMNNIIRNSLLVLIKLGIDAPEKLSKITGIQELEVKRFLDSLLQEKRIKESNGTYSLA